MVKKGYASDPLNVPMYFKKTNKYGRVMIDKDGLTLYRSVQGTSNLESLHQYLTTSFGHTMAGPYYSDILLTVVRYFYNWRMSRKNRPGFPPLQHYNGLMVDRINVLYETIFGYCKYIDWQPFNENLPLKSAYGIVPANTELTSNLSVDNEDINDIAKNNMLRYVAKRQNSSVPFLPIRGEKECRLVHQKLNEILASGESLNNQTVFDNLSTEWNTHHVPVSNKIYPKMPYHFARYVKSW